MVDFTDDAKKLEKEAKDKGWEQKAQDQIKNRFDKNKRVQGNQQAGNQEQEDQTPGSA
jgi:hypothetical protein